MKYSKELHEQLRKRYKDSDPAYVQCLLDEIERLQNERRWIPVSERLPDIGVEVLVFDERGDIMIDELCRWQSELIWADDDDGVTHWMPRPLPPEEEK